MGKNNELLDKWNKLAKELDIGANNIYCDLLYSYMHPRREYHTLDYHIGDCLNEFESARTFILQQTDKILELQFSLWFHDVIYKSKSDEEESAICAAETLRKYNKPEKFIDDVSRLILITKHKEIPKKTDEKIIVDIDLSVFGKNSRKFNEYEEKIRREYYYVGQKLFAEKRIEILEKFLDKNRPSIYFTDFFREKYEARARINLERSISKLSTYLK